MGNLVSTQLQRPCPCGWIIKLYRRGRSPLLTPMIKEARKLGLRFGMALSLTRNNAMDKPRIGGIKEKEAVVKAGIPDVAGHLVIKTGKLPGGISKDLHA